MLLLSFNYKYSNESDHRNLIMTAHVKITEYMVIKMAVIKVAVYK